MDCKCNSHVINQEKKSRTKNPLNFFDIFLVFTQNMDTCTVRTISPRHGEQCICNSYSLISIHYISLKG